MSLPLSLLRSIILHLFTYIVACVLFVPFCTPSSRSLYSCYSRDLITSPLFAFVFSSSPHPFPVMSLSISIIYIHKPSYIYSYMYICCYTICYIQCLYTCICVSLCALYIYLTITQTPCTYNTPHIMSHADVYTHMQARVLAFKNTSTAYTCEALKYAINGQWSAFMSKLNNLLTF